MDKLISMHNSVSQDGNGRNSRIRIGSRIVTTLSAAMLLLNACAPVMPTPDLPAEDLTELKTEETEITPTNTPTPTKTPTLTPTPTIAPTNTPTPTETPILTPTATREPVEFHTVPGALGYNYFYLGKEPYFEELGLRRLAFVAAEVMDIRLVGDEMEVDIRTMLRGNEIILRVHAGSFRIIDMSLPEGEGYTLITSENYPLVPLGTKVSPDFLFKERDILEDDKEKITKICTEEEGWRKRTHCYLLENFDSLSDLKTLGVQDEDDITNLILENLEEGSNIYNFDFGILDTISLYHIGN